MNELDYAGLNAALMGEYLQMLDAAGYVLLAVAALGVLALLGAYVCVFLEDRRPALTR